ncbi:MAG: enoyl-CoA hydratase-related protein [Actinomycetota bacterium]|jgi:2-(1,2-epoxy-1,2-dihydrophenyl)acetyl-CoA isomerase
MPEPQRFSWQVAGAVARLRMVWPEGRNAIDPLWCAELDAALTEVEGDGSARALLITADGPAFTVGGDMRHFRTQRDRLADELHDMISSYHRSLGRLAALPLPVISAVNGAAAGGGLGLAWCSDVVVAADDAKFATGFAALGLSGDGASTWFLPRLVGLRRAREMILHNRIVSAAEALDWGLIDRVVPAADLEAEAEAAAVALAAGPTVAYGKMRRLLWRSLSVDLDDQLTAELEAITECGTTADAREGVSAFVERRPPKFTGR